MTRPHRPIVCAHPAPLIHLREYHGCVSLIVGSSVMDLAPADARSVADALIAAADLVDTTKSPPPIRRSTAGEYNPQESHDPGPEK